MKGELKMQKILFYVSRALTAVILIYTMFFIDLTPPPAVDGPFSTTHILLFLIVLGISIAAWKLPMMGGVLFFIFAVRFYIMIANGNPHSSLIIVSILLFTAALFIWEGYLRNQKENI
jgi:hypothetical protein